MGKQKAKQNQKISHGNKNKQKNSESNNHPQVQDLKLRMEELQWGFPIATPLSLNKLMSINVK